MINFNNLTDEKIDTSIFKKLGKKILGEEGVEDDEKINCVFTDNEYIRRLNKEYRGLDVSTDVLAFSFLEGEDTEYREGMLGDIYISIEMAKENAQKYSQNFSDEIKLLFVHGLLHLLGYKDEGEDDTKQMRTKEKYYLNK